MKFNREILILNKKKNKVNFIKKLIKTIIINKFHNKFSKNQKN